MQNDLYISDISDIVETAETGVSDQRGRRKTAELHPSGAKRAETWREGVVMRAVVIGLAVASGGERERGKEN